MKPARMWIEGVRKINESGVDLFTDAVKSVHNQQQAEKHLDSYPTLTVFLGMYDSSYAPSRKQLRIASGRPPDNSAGVTGVEIGTYPNAEAWLVFWAHARML